MSRSQSNVVINNEMTWMPTKLNKLKQQALASQQNDTDAELSPAEDDHPIEAGDAEEEEDEESVELRSAP